MVTPRRSARVAANPHSPDYTEPNESGRPTKRKSEAGTSPSAKRGRKSSAKAEVKQTTIEDSMDIDKEEPKPAQNGDPGAADKPEIANEAPAPQAEPEMQQESAAAAPQTEPEKPQESAAAAPQNEPEKPQDSAATAPPKEEPAPVTSKPSEPEAPPSEVPTASGALIPDSTNGEKEERSDTQQPVQLEKSEHKPVQPEIKESEPAKEPEVEAKATEPSQDQAKSAEPEQSQEKPKEIPNDASTATNGDAVEPKARDEQIPSSILEKGIVYFFFRARVNIEDPQDVNDIARSYMILRPLPKGAKLGDGPIGDEGNCRLLAIPKKVLPLSGKDRFMSFVEGAKKSFGDLKSEFLSANDYATKTSGTSHSPAATPIAEGVYAITTTGRESHFAYMTTIPSQLGQVQKDVGIKEQGSFVVSAKNPKFPGPANASLGKDPGYPPEIMDEFRNLRWMPLQPKLLDYVNTQFLLIGESGGVDKALEGLPRDERQNLPPPKEEIEKLEGEDEIRVKHLNGDDAVFADLGISKKDFPAVPTTWD